MNIITPTPTINNITFFNQIPADIKSTTLFSQNVIAQYNISNLTAVNQSFVNISLISNRACISFRNGTCVVFNNTAQQVFNSSNVGSIFNYTLGENVVYPYNEWLSSTNFAQQHNITNLATNNNYFAITFNNMSNNTQYNFFEVMAKSTGIADIHYCNSTYTIGNIQIDPNCVEIFNGVLNFNHSHNVYSNHSLIVFSINNSRIGNVLVTPTSYFIIRDGNTNVYTISNLTGRSNIFRTSNNNGASYTDISTSLSVDSHLHQFTGSDTLTYFGCLNKSGTIECSPTNQSEILDLEPQAPVGVQILQPNASTYQEFINITYLIQTHPNTPTKNNSAIKIDLLNENNTFVKTIIANNGLNSFYYWNTYLENLSTGINYYLNITINDTANLKTSTISEAFNFSTNSRLNLSLYNNQTPSIQIINFTINLTDSITGIITQHTTTNGTIHVDLVKNRQYNIFSIANGYAYRDFNYTPTLVYNKLNTSMYGFNSVFINVYDEDTGLRINQTVDITLTSVLQQYLGNTSTGSFYIENLTANTYTISLSSSGYAGRDYSITVGNFSTQVLDTFLLRSNFTVIFAFNDYNTGLILDNVSVAMYGYVNGSLSLLENKFTDISGRVQFTFKAGTPYSFFASKGGYEDLTFSLNPILFTSYNIKMKQTNTLPLYYDDVDIYFNPKAYHYLDSGNFSFAIQSVNGLLTAYGYNLTAPCINLSFSGVSAMGDKDVKSYYANCSGTVTLQYFYTLSNGQTYNYKQSYLISNAPVVQTTFLSNKGKTFGLGDFERILIVTLINIILVGVATILGGSVIGLLIGVAVTGYFVAIGFIGWWYVGIFLVLSVLIILSKLREG